MLTEKEAILLKHLRRNSRKSLADISKETTIPISTLFDTLRKLESKAISRHVSLLDFSKIGYNIKVGFAVSSGKKKELKEFLISSPNVNTLSSLINGHDFYAECVFKHMKDMVEFKESLEKFDIKSMNENFIVEELKKEEFCV